MLVCVLGSGSAGNCTLVATASTRILVDLGFGTRSLRKRFMQSGLGEISIDALLITHGHSDHINGVMGFVNKQKTPVYSNQGTEEELSRLGAVPRKERFETGRRFQIGDIEIEPVAVSHDANEPVSFRFTAKGVSGAILTDLGELDEHSRRAAAGCDWLVLESNHDEDLLRLGPYPWYLKQRVLSRSGHLSNQALAQFLSTDFDGSATHLLLAHLSRQNNVPDLALDSALQAMGTRGGSNATRVHLTHQDKPSIVVRL